MYNIGFIADEIIYIWFIIELLHIPEFILKLYVFIHFHKSYFPYNGQNSTLSSMSNIKDKEFVYSFPIICRS